MAELSTSRWARVGVVVGAYIALWIAWRSGMEVLHEGFTYFVILFATVVCGALIRHWSVVFLGLVPVLVFFGQGAPEGVSAPSELLDFFTPVVASCAVIGAEIGRRLRPSLHGARDIERPAQRKIRLEP
jgi:hypothetical protein